LTNPIAVFEKWRFWKKCVWNVRLFDDFHTDFSSLSIR
jgi:hypothetical protein